ANGGAVHDRPQTPAFVGQLVVQPRNAFGGDQAAPKLVGVERLDQVVVDTGLHTLDDVLLVFERRHQNEIRIRPVMGAAHQSAQLQAVQAGHAPVADHAVVCAFLEAFPAGFAIVCPVAGVAESADYRLEGGTGGRAVVDDQDVQRHSRLSTRNV